MNSSSIFQTLDWIVLGIYFLILIAVAVWVALQRNKNTALENENAALNSTINEASLLTANSFKASAYTMVLGKKIATNEASKASAIDVCFTLAENMLSQKGKKGILGNFLTRILEGLGGDCGELFKQNLGGVKRGFSVASERALTRLALHVSVAKETKGFLWKREAS